MKYLLFDQDAIYALTSTSGFQSIEYTLGYELVQHFLGNSQSVTYPSLAVKYLKDGVIFIGKKRPNTDTNALKIFCFDLTTCNLFSEKDHAADLLTVMQKSFRTAIRIWTKKPFSASEHINGTKSILFPFTFPDKRRLVIERSNDVKRFATRGIDYPLLAYKYNAEEPPHKEEVADTKILQSAGEAYRDIYYATQQEFEKAAELQSGEADEKHAVSNITMGSASVERDDFRYMKPDIQYSLLTASQKRIVDSNIVTTPMRIEGAAGTGKTASLVLRAYKLLCKYRETNTEFKIAFISHSESTKTNCRNMFECYPESEMFLSGKEQQSIEFMTLLDFCLDVSNISFNEIVENNAEDAKDFQLMMIDAVVRKALDSGTIRTYRSLLSDGLRDLFDEGKTPHAVLIKMLQHEFAIQIKGRTSCLFDEYLELASIPNGLPCRNEKDKQLIFSLFTEYQNQLKQESTYDIDDVTMEALSRLNAPVWRRKRATEGYDYILVDEMHLFNINEQSIFHYLSRSYQHTNIPICFALDYSQAIGDRGNLQLDYVEKGFGGITETQQLKTVFRNSPQISELCAAIAASGTLMFQDNFHNPYGEVQSSFTAAEEHKCITPQLIMYDNDDTMLPSLNAHLDEMMKGLQCKKHEIAIISFDSRFTTKEWVKEFSQKSGKKVQLLDRCGVIQKDAFVFASPYDVNGLEFAGVILLAVDDGRVPQTAGVSDVSKHYLMYSAHNLLYLTASRAKYRLLVLGSKVNGVSPCLSNAIEGQYLVCEANADTK